jgi:hypothetical protein
MKTPFPRLAAAVFIAAALSSAVIAADSPSVLLQKAIYAEETEGNVDAAIRIYEQIATEAATNRSVLAQAQYRLAVCYQKKGNKDQAIKLLNELVQQFPGDAALLQKAKTSLTEMGVTPAEAIAVRKLPHLVPGWPEAMSQDGRFVAYEPKGGYDLAVMEIATGKSWTIAKCVKGKSPGGVAISPNGQHIAYDLSDSTIHVARIDGSEARKLLVADANAEDVWPLEWSQDSSRLFVECKQRTTASYRLVAVELKSGAQDEVARLAPGASSGSRHVTSDGRYLAIRRNSYPRRITVLDLKSGREETVIPTDAGGIVGWVPGAAKLLFLKSRGETFDLLVSELENGRPSGEPNVLRSNYPSTGQDSQPLCITRDGSIYYFIRKDRSEPSELWVMEGFVAGKPSATKTESWRIVRDIPTNEMILRTDNSMLDRKFGLTATIPAGWTIRSASRRNGETGSIVTFGIPNVPRALPRAAYQFTTPWVVPGDGFPLKEMGPKPTTPAEIDAWLLTWQRAHSQGHLNSPAPNYADYKTRPESIVPGSINGHRALRWTADFTRNGVSWIELETMIFSNTAYAVIWLQVPAANRDTAGPAFEQLVASVRFSPPQN